MVHWAWSHREGWSESGQQGPGAPRRVQEAQQIPRLPLHLLGAWVLGSPSPHASLCCLAGQGGPQAQCMGDGEPKMPVCGGGGVSQAGPSMRH